MQFLAQYVARRDAELKQPKTVGEKGACIVVQPGQGTEIKATEVNNPPQRDEEKAALVEQLQAERKKREVLSAEKIVIETKHSTFQKMLEKESNKVTSLEDKKREVVEALEVADNKNAMLQAMQDQEQV